jgi:hypothetical protein
MEVLAAEVVDRGCDCLANVHPLAIEACRYRAVGFESHHRQQQFWGYPLAWLIR